MSRNRRFLNFFRLFNAVRIAAIGPPGRIVMASLTHPGNEQGSLTRPHTDCFHVGGAEGYTGYPTPDCETVS